MKLTQKKWRQMKLKVYGTGYMGTHRAVAAVKSQKEFAALLDCTLSSLRAFCCQTGNAEEIAIATSRPGVVFLQRNNRGEPWETLEEHLQKRREKYERERNARRK